MELPCVIRDAGLIIEKTVSYEGDFWEDGSNTPAVDIMALVVYNPGRIGIRRAEISVQQGKRQLLFIITYLPPGSRVLVLERFRNTYSREAITTSSCVSLDRMEWESTSRADVKPAGVCQLQITNRTDKALSSVTLRYKRYDSELELYLGGISYQLTAAPVGAGESLEVSPLQYVDGHSRVVLVEAEE